MRFVVAGGGLAGLTAALRAVELGARVTLLEKGDRPGGSFLLSSGERYTDEGADWSETSLTRATARQPGLYAYYVLDAAGLRARVRERTVKEMVGVARDTGGTVIEAASLQELADKLGELGVPRDALL